MPFAGFDSSVYPGDVAMQAARNSLPYVFCGYYLKAPCHGNTSWLGARDRLVAMGWNCLIICVGRQVAGVSPCKQNTLSPALGTADAQQAAERTLAEGFPPGSSIYLDVEHVDPGSSGLPALQAYVQAWVTQMLASDFRPAIYCHTHNATLMQQTVEAAGGGPDVRFWVVGSGVVPFSVGADPAQSGIAFATVWQNPVSTSAKFGGKTVNIDEDVASLADPSAP